ncbi:MAG TPA: nucleotidyl transferase AbiEii/AbiGii toxin family protein [Thermoleophilia bacterium]|nr:nucleotidyl transferase AbiEii/AbiGii toxin family protein [Thermoleophilia bacterium]
MIPKAHITAWRARAPWLADAQVEQDLIISRAIVELFRVPEIASSLVFRGGTALYKLYLDPPARYSEDIDLVQARPEPIGDTLDRARAALDPWLGVPRRLLKEGRVNLVYRFDSEDAPPLKLRLKVEINTREHFTELGVVRVPFRVDNPWFTGAADVSTYVLDELLCTKLRALYQRKKGRDLFDLWHALELGRLDPKVLLACLQRYLAEEGRTVTRAQFEENLAGKRTDPDFRDDVGPLLRPGLAWDFEAAMDAVLQKLVALLAGEPWKGAEEAAAPKPPRRT